MSIIAKIKMLKDYATGEYVTPITILDAVQATGSAGQVVGLVADNTLGVMDADWADSERVAAIEAEIGDLSLLLDEINGEVV